MTPFPKRCDERMQIAGMTGAGVSEATRVPKVPAIVFYRRCKNNHTYNRIVPYLYLAA